MSKPIKMPIRSPETPADLPAPLVLPTRKKPQTCNTPTRAKPRRKIDGEVIAQMAKAVSKMLTESQAASLCGIEPRHWFEFKSRAGRSAKWEALLTAYRANRIEKLLDRVEDSAFGIGVKYPDFRAALALLKFQDQKRFGDSPAVEAPLLPVVNVLLMAESAKRIYGEVVTLPATPPALPPSTPVALLPAGEPLQVAKPPRIQLPTRKK